VEFSSFKTLAFAFESVRLSPNIELRLFLKIRVNIDDSGGGSWAKTKLGIATDGKSTRINGIHLERTIPAKTP